MNLSGRAFPDARGRVADTTPLADCRDVIQMQGIIPLCTRKGHSRMLGGDLWGHRHVTEIAPGSE